MRVILELTQDETRLLYDILLESNKPAEHLLTKIYEAYRAFIDRKHLQSDSGEMNDD